MTGSKHILPVEDDVMDFVPDRHEGFPCGESLKEQEKDIDQPKKEDGRQTVQ